MGVFEVAECESVVKIEMVPFLVALDPIFTKFGPNGGSYGLGDVPIVFLVEFYRRIGHFCENFGNVQIGQNALTTCRGIFWTNLWNFFDLEETVVMGVFQVVEFESVLKNGMAPFLVVLDSYFCTKLGITPERRVVPAQRPLHCVLRLISHKDGAFGKILETSKLGKMPLVQAFFEPIYRIRSI